jgi:hypothetical protein
VAKATLWSVRSALFGLLSIRGETVKHVYAQPAPPIILRHMFLVACLGRVSVTVVSRFSEISKSLHFPIGRNGIDQKGDSAAGRGELK